MLNHLLPVLMMMMISIAQIHADIRLKSLVRKDDLRGRLFDNPMFEITSRGSIDCAKECSKKACCKTMTFNPITKGCRGYGRQTMVGDSFTSDPGREVYQLETPPNYYTHVYVADIGLCFSLKTDPKNKHEAAVACKCDGGHLIWMDTLEKLPAVETVLRIYYNNGDDTRALIDGEDFDNANKKYVMSNGQVLPLNSPMCSPGEPNNYHERCVGFFSRYRLNDLVCSDIMPYICEY